MKNDKESGINYQFFFRLPNIGKLQKIEYLDKEKGTLGEIKAFP